MAMPKLDAQTEQTLKQFREFLMSYNKLSETCFVECCHDFTTRKVLTNEDTCAKNCLEKSLKITQRISQRFQEFQLQQTDGFLGPQSGKGGLG